MVSITTPIGSMAPPPAPLPKRPTVGMKRDSSYMDTDDEASLSTTTKRLKVAFSPNVDIRFMDDWSEKSEALVKEEVRLGIERHLGRDGSRDDTQYIKLLQLLGQDAESGEAPSGRLLKKYVEAIGATVSSLGECGKLANAVMDLSWLGRSEDFVRTFINFLDTLATAHPKYVQSITQMLVAHFARLPASLGRLPGETPVSRATMFRRVHSAVRSLLQRVPSAPDKLRPALRKEFPNDSTPTRSYVQFQHHLLRITEYEPALHADVLALITERLVSIDEQIQQDLEDLEEEAEDGLLQGRSISKTGPAGVEDSDDSDAESVSETEESTNEDELRVRELKLKVAKMDGTMDLLFEYYTPLIQGGLNANMNDAYQRLLSHFVSFILPRRTRHAQFLLFHFSQTLPEHASIFADTCVQLAFHSRESKLTRLHACAYLASFIARGAHLSLTTVQRTFSILCSEMESLRKLYEPSCRGPDKRSYSMYYAIAQAVLYIFCFRWRDLTVASASPESGDEDLSEDDMIAEGRELAWLPGIKDLIHKSLVSRLNPLKVCSPAIVVEFAKITHHIRFCYIYSIMESNKRVRLGNNLAFYTTSGAIDIGRRGTAMDRMVGEAHLQLEAYFPFDPYHLPVSKRWVDGEYNEWKLPAGMKQDEEEEQDAYSDDEDDDESENEMDDLPAGDDESVSS